MIKLRGVEEEGAYWEGVGGGVLEEIATWPEWETLVGF